MNKYMETTANLNVRERGDIIETVPKGTLLTVSGVVWHEVELEGGEYGLASGKYLQAYSGEVEAPIVVLPSTKEPPWLIVARKELGVKEITGDRDNPRVVEYHQTTTLKATDDDTPWCSSFVNWCIKQAGLKGTNSAAAISWMSWGVAVPLSQGKPGDIAVFSRTGGNHVGFHLSHDNASIKILGGNQSDEVNIATFSLERFRGLRRPA